jgi:glucokinase
MSVLGIDLGGTKLQVALFTREADIRHKENISLSGYQGARVGSLICDQVHRVMRDERFLDDPVQSIGISVPGISRIREGTVWAPNIPGWTDYPLLKEVREICDFVPVQIESDRACYIMGEMWKGNARGCSDAIFLAVGTGIGAGIVADGRVLRGANDISGSVGWLTFNAPFKEGFSACGDFEYHASGTGIARMMQQALAEEISYQGQLRQKPLAEISSHDVFAAYTKNDPVAIRVIHFCVGYWGMAAANLVSIFNPEKIIFGGGIFGPAAQFIPSIKTVALQWAQPLSMQQVSFEASALGADAGVYGAGYFALQTISSREKS